MLSVNYFPGVGGSIGDGGPTNNGPARGGGLRGEVTFLSNIRTGLSFDGSECREK